MATNQPFGPQAVADAGPAYFRPLVDPSVGGTITPDVVIEGESGAGTDYIPRYVLVTANPGDDVTAATRLMNGYPDCLMVQPEQSLEITSDTTITDVYLIGIAIGAGGAAVDIDTFTDYIDVGGVGSASGLIGRGDTDLADWAAHQLHFTFDSADDVRAVRIELSGAVDTNVKICKVQGVSYA